MPSASQCLGSRLGDFVDGTLPPDERLVCERHLVACTTCRHAVESERRVIDTLRHAGPAMPSDLQAMLLSLASSPECSGPPVPRTATSRHDVVPVLDASAPALHRSLMRAAVFAGLAAGASAAAAWSIGVSGAVVTPTNAPAAGAVTPADLRSGTANAPAQYAGRSVLTSLTVGQPPASRPVMGVVAGYSAQSSP
jgi:anti-sigma factor RsiW